LLLEKDFLMEPSTSYEKLKLQQDLEQLSLDDLAFMIGLPADLIKEHLSMDDKQQISIKDLQTRTRQLVDEYFKSNP
jgi:hypothetical protein